MKCTAKRSRDGKPCGNYAAKGSTVCYFHGASAGQVKRKAAQRLAEAEAAAAARQVFVRRNLDGEELPFEMLTRLIRERSAVRNMLLGRLAAATDPGAWAVLLPAWNTVDLQLAGLVVDVCKLDPSSVPAQRPEIGSIRELLDSVPRGAELPAMPALPLPAAPNEPAAAPEPLVAVGGQDGHENGSTPPAASPWRDRGDGWEEA